MSDQIQVHAEVRQDVGKGASRRLRRAEKVPGVIYGAEGDAQSLTLDANELSKALQNESFFSQVLGVVIDGGQTEQAVVRDMQRHPSTERVMHIDFLRVSADKPVDVHVPLHFINEDTCQGVKVGGGSLTHNISELVVSGLPKDLPEYIEVDVAALDVGESIHLSGIKLPDGVVIPELQHGADHDLLVVAVQAARGGQEEEDLDAPVEAPAAEGEQAEGEGDEG